MHDFGASHGLQSRLCEFPRQDIQQVFVGRMTKESGVLGSIARQFKGFHGLVFAAGFDEATIQYPDYLIQHETVRVHFHAKKQLLERSLRTASTLHLAI